MSNKVECSVGILTFNNEKTIKRALDSIKYFEEIIICDGGSTDDTLAIAKKYNCKIIFQNDKFKDKKGMLIDYAGVRNQLLDAVSYDWFLFIDSDEYLSKAIVDEVNDIVKKKPVAPTAYWIPRKYILGGEVVHCASTYPNKQMRFFHKKAVDNFVKKIHERIQVKEGSPVEDLDGIMFVPIDGDISLLKTRWRRYIQLEVDRREDIVLR